MLPNEFVMPPRLRDHPAELAALIASAADHVGLDSTFLEKDFWAIEALRACTFPVEVSGPGGSGPVQVIFKGGTSLSRVRLIERFSEDVDVLIRFPGVGAGAGTRDRTLKHIRDVVGEHLALPLSAIEPKESITGVKRNVRYHYPTDAVPQGALSNGVLLELGTRDGTFPTERHLVCPLIADFAGDVLGDPLDAWAEFLPFAIDVLAPERTLLEKLAALHDAAVRAPAEPAISALRRNARHLYDVHCLLRAPSVRSALDRLGPDGIERICLDIDEHSAAAGFSFTPRPAAGYGESPLLGGHAGASAFRDGYRRAMELVYGARPTLDECLDTIRDHANLL